MRSALYDIRGSWQVELPEHGVLDFRVGPSEVVFLSLFGGETTFHGHPLVHARDCRSFVAGDECVLVGDEAVYHFRAEPPALTEIVKLDRWNYSGFSQLEALQENDFIFIVYEGGAAKVSIAGQLCWHSKARLWPLSSVNLTRAGLHVDSDGVITLFDSQTGSIAPAV
jgi:hypothetical protein